MLEYYINQLPKSCKPLDYDVCYDSTNTACSDSIIVYIKFNQNKIQKIDYEGNLSMVSLGCVGFLMDILIDMPLDDVEKLKYDFFSSNNISTTPRRQKTLALPLVAIINAIKQYKNKSDFLDVEVFAYC